MIAMRDDEARVVWILLVGGTAAFWTSVSMAVRSLFIGRGGPRTSDSQP